MRIGVPMVAALLPLAWWILARRLTHGEPFVMPELGPWSARERRVLVVFGLTALCWITRTEPAGGWSAWFGATGAGDGTVALAAVVAMFLVPDGEGGQLLDWNSAAKIPWGLLILFGGGIAIARAFETSGLSEALGAALSGIAALPIWLTLLFVCLSVTFLTEVTSNTATATLLMPVMASAGKSAGIDPALLMVPAAISCSCAFMLPVATAPNAIVFGTGHVTVARMARAGLLLNLLGAVVVATLAYALLAL
jgi:sodium-dependent dicarboxylate transporter 2/3/5